MVDAARGAGGGVAVGDAEDAVTAGVRFRACHTGSRRKISHMAKSTVLNRASLAVMPEHCSTQRP
jgi:hypothetical protein